MTEYNIRLNPNCASAVHTGLKFKAGDKGITFKIAVDELDTTGTTAKIVFLRANGTSVESDITGTEGVYTYKTLGNEFAVPGKTVADVKIYESGNRESTASFLFDVCGDTMDGLGAGVGGYSDRLEQLVKEAENAGELTEHAKEELEAAENDMEKMKAEIEAVLQKFREQYSEVGALNPCGTWGGDTTYQIRDVVYHNSSSWISLVDNNTAEPTDANKTYWMRSTDMQSIIDGTTPVGDSSALGGETAKEWQGKINAIQTTSAGNITDAGWYRIAQYVTDNVVHVQGYESNGCELIIKRQSGIVQTEEHCLRLASNYKTGQEIMSLLDKSATQRFTKCRYTIEGTIAYLEVYCSAQAGWTFFAITNGQDYRFTWQAITPTLTEETVEGVTVTTTYDIPANAKPVTDLDIAEAMSAWASTVNAFTEQTACQNFIDNYSADFPNNTSYAFWLHVRYNGDTIFGGGGQYKIIGNKAGNGYEVQIAIAYGISNGKVCIRACYAGTWSKFDDISTTADLANYLALTGGTLHKSGQSTPLDIKGLDTYSLIRFLNAKDEEMGRLGFEGADNPVFYTPKVGSKTLHHDGNSAKVVQATSAPSDTTTVWVDTANKVTKIYKDGAWTALA